MEGVKKTKAKGPLGSNLSEMTVELLQKNLAFREAYIKGAFKEKDPALKGLKLRNMVDALGRVGRPSKAAGLNDGPG